MGCTDLAPAQGKIPLYFNKLAQSFSSLKDRGGIRVQSLPFKVLHDYKLQIDLDMKL